MVPIQRITTGRSEQDTEPKTPSFFVQYFNECLTKVHKLVSEKRRSKSIPGRSFHRYKAGCFLIVCHQNSSFVPLTHLFCAAPWRDTAAHNGAAILMLQVLCSNHPLETWVELEELVSYQDGCGTSISRPTRALVAPKPCALAK